MIQRWIDDIRRWASGWLARLTPKPSIIVSTSVAHVLDIPEFLESGHAVLVAEDPSRPQWLGFDCPCRRHHRLLINLADSRRPRWTYQLDKRGKVTLYPSVDSVSDVGRCHFWLRRGTTTWIGAPAAPVPATLRP